MSKLNNSVFNPIKLKNSSSDFLRFILLGIKLKYTIVYIPFLFISYYFYKFLNPFIYNESILSFLLLKFLIIFFILTFCLFNAINSKLIFERFNGNINYALKDSFKFVRSNLQSFILPTVIISIITIFFLIFLYLLLKITTLVSVGFLVFSIVYLLCFFISLVVIFNIFVLIISIFFNSSIFCIYGGDAFTTTFKIFSLASSNFFKLIKYSILNFLISFLFTFFYFFIFALNYLFINEFFLEKKNYDFLKLSADSIICNKSIQYNAYIDQISHSILEFNLLFILFFIVSIFFSLTNVGNFISILNMKKYNQ